MFSIKPVKSILSSFPKGFALIVVTGLVSAGLSPVRGAVVIHNLDEFQTVDATGAFPGAGSNNVDKFDTAGSNHNAVAPFTTTVYVRTSTNGSLLERRVQLYIQFDLASLTSETITSATLEFSAYSLNDSIAANTPSDLFVSQVANDWAPGGGPNPVFNPAIVGAPIGAGSIMSVAGGDVYDSGLPLSGSPTYRNVTPYTIDVTSIVQNWQSGAANHGFHLELNDSQTENNGLGIDGGTLVLRVTSVPEPSSAVLAGMAGIVILGLRRRRS